MITFGYDIETTGLNPYENKIITIQFRRNNKNYIWKEWKNGEKQMILDFLNEWKKIPRSKKKGGDTFVAFNVKFDITFLLIRALILKLNKEPGWNDDYIWQNIAHGPAWLDLYQLLGDQLMSFAKWRKCLVGSLHDTKNDQIPLFYQNKEYEKIESYVKDELLTLENVYNTLIKEPFYGELKNLREKAQRKYYNKK